MDSAEAGGTTAAPRAQSLPAGSNLPAPAAEASSTPTVPARRVPPATTRRWPRVLAWCLAAAAGLVVSVVGLGLMVDEGAPDPRIALVMGVELVCGTAALVLLARVLAHRGLRASLVCAALGALTGLGAPAALVAVALVATRRRVAPIAGVVSACLVGGAGSLLLGWDSAVGSSPGEDWFALALVGALVAVAVLIGLDMGSREQVLQALAERLELSEQVQAVRIEQGRAQERARIAREMHDSLAHSLSLVALHAGVLESRPDLDAATVQDSARAIRESATTANSELRAILQVLHGDDPGDRSGATWEDVLDLVAQEEQAGARVALHLDGGWKTVDGRAAQVFAALPAPVRHTVVRVVQETLTNARRHAPGAPVDVSLGESQDGVTLLVTNPLTSSALVGAPAPAPAPGPAPGGGLGLPGLAERVSLVGGSLSAGERVGRFEVAVHLPVRTPARAAEQGGTA